jgi:hypothetical protein
MHAVAPDHCMSTGELAGSPEGATKSCIVKGAVLNEGSRKELQKFKNQTNGDSAYEDLNQGGPLEDFLEKASTKCVIMWNS